MPIGNSTGYQAFEKMYHYAITSKMYDVQPGHFVLGMETFLFLWILGFITHPALSRGIKNRINNLKITRSIISHRDNRNNKLRTEPGRGWEEINRLSDGQIDPK